MSGNVINEYGIMPEDDLEPDMGAPEMGLDDAGGGPGPMDDLEDDEGLGDEAEMVEVDKNELRQLLDDVELGEKSADDAWEQLTVGDLIDDGGLDELGAEDPMAGMDIGGSGMDSLGTESYGECYEDVQRIANLLTEDPDIFGV